MNNNSLSMLAVSTTGMVVTCIFSPKQYCKACWKSAGFLFFGILSIQNGYKFIYSSKN